MQSSQRYLQDLIAAPIKTIAGQANIIASGDFTKTDDIIVKGEDEIGHLQRDFK